MNKEKLLVSKPVMKKLLLLPELAASVCAPGESVKSGVALL